MTTKREFLKLSAATLAATLVQPFGFLGSTPSRVLAATVQYPQGTPLPGSAIPKFVDPLPLLSLAGGPMETIVAGEDEIKLTMREFQANVMPSTFVPALGAYTGTWVWGYRATDLSGTAGTYIGPVIVATRGTPTQIRFVNGLPLGDADSEADTNTFWRAWTDQSLHWANPLGDPMVMGNLDQYQGPVPAVPHLHGGEVPPWLDGGPDAWFTSDGEHRGKAYYSKDGAAANEAIYRYPNSQEAAMIWFHDHALGATRINVYAGIAGAYALIDPNLQLPTGLHPVGLQQGADGPVDYLVPLVIQDRSFDTNGQLYFANLGINPEHPYWIPELVGDATVVNGKVWPYLNVEPRRYRFLIINGSNARTYELFVLDSKTKSAAAPMWQIGTDGGYLDKPVKIDASAPKSTGTLQVLRLMPGERADVIIDFAGFAGRTLIMRNNGKTPYPAGTSPSGSTVGRIVQFRVAKATTLPGPDASYDPASGIPLRPPMIRLASYPPAGTLAAGVTPQKTRALTLNEVMGMPRTVNGIAYPGGPLEILVNNTKWNGKSVATDVYPDGTRSDFTPSAQTGNDLSELPQEGDTEVWEIVNLTADAHPIHTHLTQFQLVNRQSFDVGKYNAAYAAAFPGSTVTDPMTGLPYAAGVYIPAFGPPLAYSPSPASGGKYGGNPDVTPYLKGPVTPANANEAGWKDTVMVPPGMVTRFVVRYAPTDKAVGAADLHYPFDPSGADYVWHCHIIDHEDNEMMRPYQVIAKSVTRTYVKGTDY